MLKAKPEALRLRNVISEKSYNNICKRRLLKGMRDEDMVDTTSRLQQFVQAVDLSWDKFLNCMDPDISPYIKPDWFYWHYLRLSFILALEWAYQKAKSGAFPTDDKTLHDFHDMQYVSYLSRANALLTNDKKLCIPLAQAAFPDKDTFKNIDKVFEDYIYD